MQDSQTNLGGQRDLVVQADPVDADRKLDWV